MRAARLLVFALALGLAGQPARFAELGNQALAAAQAGRYQEAVAAYQEMLRIEPGNRGVRYDCALALQRLGRNRESLATLGRPADADSFVLAGINHRALGDLRLAEADLRAAFRLSPEPQIAADLGTILLSLDKHQEAEKFFARCPEETRCIAGLGLAAYATGRNAVAEKQLAAAVAREPREADLHAALADVYTATERYADAEKAYAEAIRLDARNAEYRVKAGRNLLRMDKEPAARERFEQAAAIDPLSADAHFELGRLAASASDETTARRHLEAAAAIDPGRAAAHYQLGLLYRRLSETARSTAAMRRFEQLRQQDRPFRVEMAPPSLVVEGPREERRWGRYQFPTLHRMADGRLICFVHVEADSAASYGMPQRVFVSADDGLSWREEREAARQAYGLRLSATEYLVTETPPALAVEELSLPPVAGTFNSYGSIFSLYRWNELSADLRRIFFRRFTNGAWSGESTVIEDAEAMRYVVGGKFPRIWWGDMEAGANGVLTAITYPHISSQGPPFRFACASWRSQDRGRTWRLLGRIPYQPSEKDDAKAALRDGFTEPAFTRLKDGSLYAVLRTTDGNGSGPMYAVRSVDGGRSFSKPAVIAPNGVLPRLLRMGNGMLVLASGRPGVQLRFSQSGLAGDWSEPVDVVPPTADKLDVDSCGYTSLQPLDSDTLLIVYSWFRKPDEEGQVRKAVLARRIRLTPTKPAGSK